MIGEIREIGAIWERLAVNPPDLKPKLSNRPMGLFQPKPSLQILDLAEVLALRLVEFVNRPVSVALNPWLVANRPKWWNLADWNPNLDRPVD